MKLVYLTGNMPYNANEDALVVKRLTSVFKELEADVDFVDLGKIHPPFFEGEATVATDNIIEKIRACDGLVIQARARLMPSAVLLNFFEYLELPEYGGVLSGKHVMLVVLSADGGEKTALGLLYGLLSSHGSYCIQQVGLQSVHINDLDGEPGSYLDRTCEDFYRAVRGRRSYIVPRDFSAGRSEEKSAPRQIQASIESFTNEQEQEVEELSRLFTKKYQPDSVEILPESPVEAKKNPPEQRKSPEEAVIPVIRENVQTAEPLARPKTAKQMTQSLPHYFQPQPGLKAIIQFNIFGEEEFNGYLYIHSTECTYTEGQAPAPDIVIIADSAMWLDVLGGKFTAQKAFMVGGLKVRGDFVLLSKFDSLFRKE